MVKSGFDRGSFAFFAWRFRQSFQLSPNPRTCHKTLKAVYNYESPLGIISVGMGERGVKKICLNALEPAAESPPPEILTLFAWFDKYFAGENPSRPDLPLEIIGTAFQKEVWRLISEIPYGSVESYGEIARKLAPNRNLARAAGAACGANPLPLLVPCHRVVSASGLGGFAYPLELKKFLLRLEEVKDPRVGNL